MSIGGAGAWRVGVDRHTCPRSDGGPHVGGPVTQGSGSVLINGSPAVRQGDAVVERGGQRNPVRAGCASVLIGD